MKMNENVIEVDIIDRLITTILLIEIYAELQKRY